MRPKDVGSLLSTRSTTPVERNGRREPCENSHPTRLPLANVCSEALAVDNGWTRFIILSLTDPHLLEGAQGRQDRATNPHGVLALWGGDNLDLHGGGRQGSELLGHPLANAGEHRRPARKHDVSVEVFANVDIALHDGLERGVMDATGLLSNETGLEKNLRATEALTADRDDVSIR